MDDEEMFIVFALHRGNGPLNSPQAAGISLFSDSNGAVDKQDQSSFLIIR